MDQLATFTLMDLVRGAGKGTEREVPKTPVRARDAAVADAAAIFKALGHEGRLRILCHLAAGECSVSQLENLIDARQSVVSQHLTRLRADRLVQFRREGQNIYYSILDQRVADLLKSFAVCDGAKGGRQDRRSGT